MRLRLCASLFAAAPLPGAAEETSLIWRKDAVTVQAAEGALLEGRLRAPDGQAWLRLAVADPDGKSVARLETPRLQGSPDWTYVAVELHPAAAAGGGELLAAVEFWGTEGAEAKDARLSPLSPRVTANGDFEAPLDRKGRVPSWGEEKDGSLLPGRRAGGQRLEANAPRGGKACLALSCAPSAGEDGQPGEWYGAASIDYPVPPWSDRFAINSMARAEGGLAALMIAVWTDEEGRVLRADQGPPVESERWRRLSTGAVEPPAGARHVRIVLVARRQTKAAPGAPSAWFDDVDLVTLPPRLRALKSAVNQVGYETSGPKSAVIMTNFFPADSGTGVFEVLDESGHPALGVPLSCAGRIRGEGDADWGWYFWRADFSSLARQGTYRARARVGGTEGSSFPFAVGRDLLFKETAASIVDFFFVQRCGFAVPGWHQACHLDDARLPGGARRDLSGGWHSAGDYNKISWEYGDGGAMFALVTAAESAPEVFSPFDRDGDGLPDVLDEAWWGGKYLAKLQVPETGALLKDIQQGPDRQSWMRWVAPEAQTDNTPGTADDPLVMEGEGHSPLAPGGWARLGKLLEARGVKSDYIERGVKLWEHATESKEATGQPLLLLSALDLHRLTQEERFLDFARHSASRLLGARETAEASLRGGYGDSGDIPAAALASFALAFPREPLARTIRDQLARHLDRMVAEPQNPFGVTRQKAGAAGYFFEASSVYGQNFLFACRAWSALLIHRLLGDRRALAYAIDQLDFILGKNPFGLCMLEGKGSFNPPRYHHRYDSIPGRERGAVPGAIPNGFVRDSGGRDRPGFDLSTGGRPHPSYRTNEPWLVHDVFYLLAVSALHEVMGREE